MLRSQSTLPMMSTKTPQTKAPAVRPAEKEEKIFPDSESAQIVSDGLDIMDVH